MPVVRDAWSRMAWARETKTKVVALCPFAKAQFDKDPSIRDVLV